ncbi:hypothetical protein Y032_0023g737 [Ancylostoma ceylanicum]|uniref:Uncharacterized protein n=1 Tax=Ancylostoma ceylanicum TaxID=53326 RepID=A0A016UXS0_9BILA|nr:hypothetical protein Y032_0023g737 [Ancylostoma ceylanicum]
MHGVLFSYNHPVNHFTSYVLENMDRIKEAVHANKFPIDLFLQTFARGIVRVEDMPKFNLVVERLAPAVPVKLSAMLSSRVRSVSVWMSTYGDSVINNITVIMHQINTQKSILNIDRFSSNESLDGDAKVAGNFLDHD